MATRPRTKAKTTPSASTDKSPQDLGASNNGDDEVQSEPLQRSETKRTNNMVADTGSVDSIITYEDDIDDAEAPPAIPADTYRGQIRNAVKRVSPNTGNEYVDVTFYISTDELPADFPANDFYPDGVLLHYRRVPTADDPTSRWQMKQFLQAIRAPKGSQLDLNDWVDKALEAAITVVHEPAMDDPDRAVHVIKRVQRCT